MAELLRNGLSKDAAGDYPMCLAMTRCLSDPIINSMLQPLPKPSERAHQAPVKDTHQTNRRPARDHPYPDKGKGRGRGSNKNKHGGGKGGWKGNTSKGGPGPLPGGLYGHSQTKDKRRICYGFNLGTCSDSNCERGAHVCCQCFGKDHSFQSCPKRV